MSQSIKASGLRNYHIGDVATLTCYGLDGVTKRYEVTGKLLAFRRTFDGEEVQEFTIVIEGVDEVTIPANIDRFYAIELYRR